MGNSKKSSKLAPQTKRIDFGIFAENSELHLNHRNIEQMMNSPEFISFALSIEHQIDDGVTFNEILSSPEIIAAATKIIEKFSTIKKGKKENNF